MIDNFLGSTDYGMQERKVESFSSDQPNLEDVWGESNSMKECIINDQEVTGSPAYQGNSNSTTRKDTKYGSSSISSSSSAKPVLNIRVNSGTCSSNDNYTCAGTLHLAGLCNVVKDASTPCQGKVNVSTRQEPTVTSLSKDKILHPTKSSSKVTPKFIPQTQGNCKTNTVPMILKIVPDLNAVKGVNPNQVKPLTVVGTVTGEKEVNEVTSPHIVLNRSSRVKGSPQNSNASFENTSDNFMKRQEKLKLKTLLGIEKELKNLSQIQLNILKTQEQILNAVKGNVNCEENFSTGKKQERGNVNCEENFSTGKTQESTLRSRKRVKIWEAVASRKGPDSESA